MTQAQKTELHNLDHKWHKTGLNKAELKRRSKLKQIDASEVNALAQRLSDRMNSKHNTSVIPRNFGPVSTVYVNSVV